MILIKYDQDHQMKNDERGGVCALHSNHMKCLMFWCISSGTLHRVPDSVKYLCFLCSVFICMSTLPYCEKEAMDLPLHLITASNVTENRHKVHFSTFCKYD